MLQLSWVSTYHYIENGHSTACQIELIDDRLVQDSEADLILSSHAYSVSLNADLEPCAFEASARDSELHTITCGPSQLPILSSHLRVKMGHHLKVLPNTLA